MEIRIRPSFVLYILSIAFLSSIQRCMAVLTALIIHELGHYAACIAFGERIRLLELTPFGGIMTFAEGKPRHKGIQGCIVALSGPLANYLLILFASSGPLPQICADNVVKEVILANLSMIMLNILPVLPLDGGQMVFAAGYYFFTVSKLIVFLCTAGVFAGVGIVSLAVYGLITFNTLNCSLLLIGVYIVCSAVYSKKNMMAENIYSIIQEQCANPRPVHRLALYRIQENIPILSLLEYLVRDESVLFLIDHQEHIQLLDAKKACELLLQAPGLTLQEALLNTNSRVFINKSFFCP